MPNLNGDNALLKALLQTAPKNASLNYAQNVMPSGDHLSTEDDASNAPKKHKTKSVKSGKKVAKLNEMESVLNPKIIQTKSKKRKISNEQKENKTTEVNAEKLLDQLKSLPFLSMNQPIPSPAFLNVSFPGKNHSNLLKKHYKSHGECFEVQLDQANSSSFFENEQKFMEYILSDVESRRTSTNNQLTMDKHLRNIFKICSARVEKPPLNEIKENNDSKTRLIEALKKIEEDDEEDELMETAEPVIKMECEDFLRKRLKREADDNTDDAASPTIAISHPETLNFNETSNPAPIENKLTASIALKISRKAAKNIRGTLVKLSDLLFTPCPSSWDLARMVSAEKSERQERRTETRLTLSNSETGFNLQSLANVLKISNCKFCESAMFDLEPNRPNVFCSEYCSLSYDKFLIIKQKCAEKEAAEVELNKEKSKSIQNRHLVLEGRQVLRWSEEISSLLKPPQGSNVMNVAGKFETLKSASILEKRHCVFCKQCGDLEPNGPGRLLALDVGQWSHLNCALWSNEVYETMNGALINVENAFKRCVSIECCFCHQRGASIKCFSQKCNNYYHLQCALRDKCAFIQDKV